MCVYEPRLTQVFSYLQQQREIGLQSGIDGTLIHLLPHDSLCCSCTRARLVAQQGLQHCLERIRCRITDVC